MQYADSVGESAAEGAASVLGQQQGQPRGSYGDQIYNTVTDL
jgi:hypothetical protein